MKCFKGIKVEVNGVEFPSITKAAEYHKVIPSTAFSRLRRGWTVQAAVTRPIQCRIGSLGYHMHYSK